MGSLQWLLRVAFVLSVSANIFLFAQFSAENHASNTNDVRERKMQRISHQNHNTGREAHASSSRMAKENRTPSQMTLKAQSKTTRKTALYLSDLKPEEVFHNYTGKDIPLLQRLRQKFPRMRMRFFPIPYDRWDALENTTCVQHGKRTDFDGMATEQQQRMPYALILGAQKAGTSALAKYLFTHSQVARTRKELHFLAERMDHYHTQQHASKTGGIDAIQSQNHYMAHMKMGMAGKYLQQLDSDHLFHVIDATPTYLAKSDRVPQRVLCLCPWARLIVILRDPIARAYSQYNMEMTRKIQRDQRKRGALMNREDDALIGTGKKQMQRGRDEVVSFEDFLREDYSVLLETGVLLPDGATIDELQAHAGSERERNAWKIYTKLGGHMVLGRGLYALQIRHWKEAYREAGQPFPLLAIRSEALQNETEETYKKILDFLELPHEFPKEFHSHHERSYHRVEPMSKATYELLSNLYQPYDDQLMDLLGPSWSKPWPREN